MSLHRLDQLLLNAHDADDRLALIDLYQQAGELMLDQGQLDAGCFYLTQAYVFALEAGEAKAKDIKKRLVKYGREQ